MSRSSELCSCDYDGCEVARTIALSPWCQRRHDLNDVSDRELIQGNLRCGCWVDGDRAARVLRARRLVEARTR